MTMSKCDQVLSPAAVRHFFDTLVTRHAAPLNSFQLVLGRKNDILDGKTPKFTIRSGSAGCVLKR